MEEKLFKLPVITIVVEAMKFMWQSKKVLLLKTGLPLFILISISLIDSEIPDLNAGFSFLFLVIAIFCYVLLAVNCHRIALLSRSSVHGYGIRLFRKREWRFIAWLLSIYLIFVFFVMIFTTTSHLVSSLLNVYISYILYGVIVLLGCYIFSRLSPILPATAIDYGPDIYWSWDITYGNGWRMVIIICALPFITGVITSFFNELGENIIYVISYELLTYLFIMFEIFALSLAFKYLQQNNSNKALNSDAVNNTAPVS